MSKFLNLFKPVETEQVTYIDSDTMAAARLEESRKENEKLLLAKKDWYDRLEKSKQENPLPKENYRIIKVTETTNHIPEVYWIVQTAYHEFYYPYVDTNRYGNPKDWDDDPAVVTIQWGIIGPKRDDNYGRYNRFSTFEEAKNWLKAYLAPDTEEVYFSEDSFNS